MSKLTNRTSRTAKRKQATRSVVPTLDNTWKVGLSPGHWPWVSPGNRVLGNTGTNVDNGGLFNPSQGTRRSPTRPSNASQGTSTDGTPLETTTSGSDGSYSFTNLATGTYTLLEIPRFE